jgi:hypothetical protein
LVSSNSKIEASASSAARTISAVLAGPTIGSGPDILTLSVSQDAWKGDAQFTMSVDGKQIGGVQTVDPSALRSDGGLETFTFEGVFGSGRHNIQVKFLNDAWGGTSAADRNLYVTNLVMDGTEAANHTASLFTNGSASFSVDVPAPTPVSLAGPTIGNGPDTLSLSVSQDAWKGDAQFTIDVNGKQIGGVQTVDPSVLHSAGGTETFTVKGDFATASGAGTATVNFLNDAYGGTHATDRNLYVTNVVMDGTEAANHTASLFTNGSASFGVTVPVSAPAPTPVPAPTSGATFDYSIQFNDPNSYAGSLSSSIEADLKAALQDFEGKIYGKGILGVELDIVPSSSSNSGELADGGPSALVAQGFLDGKVLAVPSSINELLTANHIPGYSSDIVIHVPQSALGEIYFDPNPAAGDNIASVAPSKYDAITIFEHEITHGLGFISLRDPSTGTLGSVETEFDHYSTMTSSGADYFTGPAAEAVYGGPVPITTLHNGEQYSHLGNNPSGPLANDLMSGIGVMNGVTHSVSALDLAILRDIGVPETSTASAVVASADSALQSRLSAAKLSVADVTANPQVTAGAINAGASGQPISGASTPSVGGNINIAAAQPVAGLMDAHKMLRRGGSAMT